MLYPKHKALFELSNDSISGTPLKQRGVACCLRFPGEGRPRAYLNLLGLSIQVAVGAGWGLIIEPVI